MKFKMSPNSYIHEKISVAYIMKHVFIALLPIVIYAIIKNGFSSFSVILSSVIFTFVFDTLYFFFTKKFKEKIPFSHKFSICVNLSFKSYSIISGIILGLIIPIYTPVYMIAFGVFGAIIVARHFFGGFGYNLFNPAAIGYLFIMAAYIAPLKEVANTIAQNANIDVITSATPLTIVNDSKWIISSANYFRQVPVIELIFGVGKSNLYQTSAEASAFLVLLSFVYLLLKKLINWRITVYFIGTIFVISFIIGIQNGMGLYYPIIHIFSGGVLFGAIFMATDPVTIPSTPLGHIVAGILLGVFTMLIRIAGPNVEGVITAILAINILSPMINDFTLGRSLRNPWSTKPVLAMTLLVCFVLSVSFWLSSRVTNLNRPVVYEEVIIYENI